MPERSTERRAPLLAVGLAPLIALLWLLLLGAQLGGAVGAGHPATVANWAAKVQQLHRQASSALGIRAAQNGVAVVARAPSHQADALNAQGGDLAPIGVAQVASWEPSLQAAPRADSTGAPRQFLGWSYPSRGPPLRA